MSEKYYPVFQDLAKSRPPEGFRGRSAVYVQLWWIVQQFLVQPSPQAMYDWRRYWFQAFGGRIGKKVLLRPSVSMTYPWKVTIGDYSWIGDNVALYSLGEISIGSYTVISQRSYLCTGSHDYSSPSFDLYQEPIRIGNEVWVAADVFIGPGVSIGDGSIVGARSTVLSDLPEAMVCYGNPAIPIRPREPHKSP